MDALFVIAHRILAIYTTLKNEGYKILHPLANPIEEFCSELDTFDIIFLYTIIFIVTLYIYKKIASSHLKHCISYLTLIIKLLEKIKSNLILLLNCIPFVNSFQDSKLYDYSQYEEFLNIQNENLNTQMNEVGIPTEKIEKKAEEYKQNEFFNPQKITGSIYSGYDQKFENNVKEFSKHYLYTNPMHFDVFPSARQMEAEVIRMTGELFGQPKEVFGVFTNGGSEAVFLAMLSYRNEALQTKNISVPNIVIPETAHPNFHKAGHLFNIEVRVSKLDKDFNVNLKQLRSLIDANTICIVGSVPNYVNGLEDPIEELAQIALERKIGFHVDASLGGFILPFAKDNNIELKNYDFNINGITSISIHHHFYGLGPKGSGVILYKTKELRGFEYFAISKWSGGLYATPSLTGSKSGVTGVATWFALVSQGRKKKQRYASQAKTVIETTQELVKEINKLPEVQVIGNPKICALTLISRNGNFNIWKLYESLKKKGWFFETIQKPKGIRILVTVGISQNLKLLIKDLKSCIEEVKQVNELEQQKSSLYYYGITSFLSNGQSVSRQIKGILTALLKS